MTAKELFDFSPGQKAQPSEAQEWYEVGLRYRLAGWVGLAREALAKVIEMSPDQEVAEKARRVLKSQLPGLAVPPDAEQRNIEGFNLMGSDPSAARAIFEELIRHYPDFEWPYNNLARLKLMDNDIEGARELIKYVLAVNPNLLSTIDLMVKTALMEKDYQTALSYLRKALELKPTDEGFRRLLLAVKMELNGTPPDAVSADLDAQESLDLGMQFQLLGRFELARQGLKQAIEKDGDGLIAELARMELKTQVPRLPVPLEAEERYLDALNTAAVDQDASMEKLRSLTADFPDFEYPYLILAGLLRGKGDRKKARAMLKSATSRNPDFLSAILLQVDMLIEDEKYAEALSFVERIRRMINADNIDFSLTLDLLEAHCHLYRELRRNDGAATS